MARHYEVTVTGGQLAISVVAAVVLLLVAFGLGVGVGSQGRRAGAAPSGPPPLDAAPAAAPTPEAVPTEPTLLMAEAASAVPTVLPTPMATALPTPAPTAIPTLAPVTPVPTARPAPTRRPEAAPHRGVWVQAGAFSREASAAGVRQRVVALGFTPGQVRVVRGGDGKYRVWLGPFPDDESAGRVAGRMRAQGFPGAFVVNE